MRWMLGQKRRGEYKPEFSPWRHTGSPKIRGVINLSVELANPTTPSAWQPGLRRWGQGCREQRNTDRGDRKKKTREMRAKNMLY